jgi:hypothetical protein
MKKERISLRLDEDSINILNIIMEHCGCTKTDAIQLALDMTIGSFSTKMINFHFKEVYKPNYIDGRTQRHVRK